MPDYHFISYSSADAFDFALKLRDALIGGKPSIPAWRDKDEIKPGRDWDEEIVQAIRTCRSMIFIMTRDSVMPQSNCKNEWTRALSYKKPVIPILLHQDSEMPFRLGSRQYIDFTSDFASGLAKLRTHIRWLASPEGELQLLKDRLEDAKRDLSHAAPNQQDRIRKDIEQLEINIENQERIIADPQGVKRQVEASIKTRLELERQPVRPVSRISQTKFINPPPGAAPDYFQDRTVETKLIADFLKSDAQRMMTVIGRGGMGKTAMVCRLLKSLESGKLPDNGEEMNVDGIVYLGEYEPHKVSEPNIFSDLCKLLPDDIAKNLDDLHKNPKTSTLEKMQVLLGNFPRGRIILLLDNFEKIMDQASESITDPAFEEALCAILNLHQHGVKVIITTRTAPKQLAFVHPERQKPLDLNKGLESPYAENILKEMDYDGRLELKYAPMKDLSEARERTQGNPRALEHLFAILASDRNKSLPEILKDTKKMLPERVLDVLVGEAFSRLDNNSQRVMEALSVYGRPVTPAAIDYMLSPEIPGIDSAPVLGSLLNMHFVRKEEGRYYLHPVDRSYALSRIPSGNEGEIGRHYMLYALYIRGAEYFKHVRLDKKDWKSKGDLAPQLGEFDLRIAAQDYETAANVLLEIDYDYLLLWGHYKIIIDMHELLKGKLTNPEHKIKSLTNSGRAYHYIGDYPKAIDHYELAMKIAQEIGDRINEGIELGNIGNSYRVQGFVKKSIEYCEKALKISQEIGDRISEGIHLGNLGIDYRQSNKMVKAIDYIEKALDIARVNKDRTYESRWLTDIGLIYRDLGNWAKAEEYYGEAIIISQQINDKRREGFLLGEYGTIYLNKGNNKNAMEYYETALKISRDIGDRSNENKWLGSLGNAHRKFDSKKAIEYYLKAIIIAMKIGNKGFEGRWLNNLGEVLKNEERYKEAIACFLLAQEIRINIEDKHLKSTRNNLTTIKKQLGKKEFEKLRDEVTLKGEEVIENLMMSMQEISRTTIL